MRLPACVACAALAFAACGGTAPPPPPARAYVDPGQVESADWRLHYALTPTTDLPSAIAGSYGIEQRPNLALLTIALVPAAGTTAPAPDAATVAAVAVSLTGNRTPLALRRADAHGAPTWIAAVAIRHREPLTIEIRARARADGAEIRARFTREFPVE